MIVTIGREVVQTSAFIHNPLNSKQREHHHQPAEMATIGREVVQPPVDTTLEAAVVNQNPGETMIVTEIVIQTLGEATIETEHHHQPAEMETIIGREVVQPLVEITWLVWEAYANTWKQKVWTGRKCAWTHPIGLWSA